LADEALTAGAVARRLGIAVTTLRTWHQRYGLGPSEHVPGQHRRYTPADLERLQVMRRLIGQGIAPAEAAAWVLRAPGTPNPPAARDGGGQAIPLGRADPAARGLARASMRLDAAAMRDILETVIADRGVVRGWEEVAMPVLIGIGERYEATMRFIEVEHLTSRAITEALTTVPRPDSAGGPARVLLAATDEEQHTLPLEALAAALAEVGVACRLLGPRVPAQALLDAVTRTGPAVVVLWSQLIRTGDVNQLARVATTPHPPMLIAAAGPGWPHELPPGVVQLTSLTEAVKLIQAAAS
jgi:MerR family transcriptional regulator, light-induced transcriptional regulator